MIPIRDVNVDFDRDTGAILQGWPVVAQSLQELFLTSFGVRVMREYYGSLVPRALGRNMTEETILALITSIVAAIDVFEPRFRVVKMLPTEITRGGALKIEIEGEYIERALLGDNSRRKQQRFLFTQEDAVNTISFDRAWAIEQLRVLQSPNAPSVEFDGNTVGG
jgi:phage baseplate assembly protein W